MPDQLQDFLRQAAERVETTLSQAFAQPTGGAEKLFAAMRYAALGPGKRLRPALVYACGQALGGRAFDPASCDAAAAALECIHAYSLVHDDLPAMDDDDLRRGRPTCHIQFDEASAILAGDALQTAAFELLLASSTESALKLNLLQELAVAAGGRGMVAGQAIDLDAVDKTLDLAHLERMHRLKTGALIRASARMGALLGGAGCGQLQAVTRYAEVIGLAFQVQDDILDVTSDTATLGKTQGADAARNKPTYVSLLGLDGAREKLDGLHGQAIDALAQLDGETRLLRQLADYIVQRSH
ncbi:polyprenyl synthetase family protein [Microbulbifer thermotolerans]|uniref:Polyprenyl synthetase family protein n=1 Tax=Microbulbifer thermotolerans TaxID=252514 RepID=A0AB35HX63_MICTH|nr:farnesyl diphosphate synthase [Microbulbifer thermotolerans]MCX2784145.1 polyprenyl synthetase family protein [Microbulbifer thermotolerans]MCX2801033.1 polyprenyl synthetase family protein [Microbulbifer thermotolerans]MCX2831592.1 polyprenyl synthetase family protein [Microbulbifer thermotolerans]